MLKSKIVRTSRLFLAFLIVFSIVNFNANANANPKNSEKLSVSGIMKFKKNSMERYCYSKAVETGKSFKEVLEEERNQQELLGYDEYVGYRTLTKKAGTITDGNNTTVTATIGTEMKVLISREYNKIVEVIDFGSPYCKVEEFYATWSGGGFNINRTSSTRARISTTGEFIISEGSLTVGNDIISVTFNLGARTRLMTLSCIMGY